MNNEKDAKDVKDVKDEKNAKVAKDETSDKKDKEVKKGKSKTAILLGLAAILAIGAGIGFHFIRQSMTYLITDNARVTANLIHISSNTPGTLERFSITEGQLVEENQVIGWVEHGEAMRSPVDGVVVHTSAIQDQSVLPMEQLAVIVDTSSIHIQANIEETDIMQVRVGQPVSITIDGLGNRQFSGYISEIGHITQAELAGTALFFNTGGTFTRVTHLIPVKINIIDDPAAPVDLTRLIGVNARVRIPVAAGEVFEPAPPANNITTSGTVESITTRNIYSTLGFKIDQVYKNVGDRVEAGQVLAVLDTADLELTIAQQRVAIELARQGSQVTTEDAQRMLNEATAGLANNTNLHILSAEAALQSADANLLALQQSYNDAMRDYTEGTNPQIASADSILNAARVEVETAERNHTNASSLYSSGVLSHEEMRQAENALTFARNQYNNARTSYDNAVEFQQRNLSQLRTALQSARFARQNAGEMRQAANIAAQQDIERLRSHVAGAEIGGSVEHLELVLAQLERHLNDSTITAPVSGTITVANAREGEVALGRLFVIEDTDNLRVITNFREYDIAKIYEGMEVQINSEYTGMITRINPAASEGFPVAQFETEVAVLSLGTDLRIGMNVVVKLD